MNGAALAIGAAASRTSAGSRRSESSACIYCRFTRKNCFSPALYRNRNAIERMFGRLKDFRRIATRYDRLADNFLAAVCLVATVSYWL